ncbi:hypothetical protein BC832DRAFT_24785 [Gaertneriomyces semiglobifer]|nr:hypothetical protein BC832DRAFT_24785 [Gaertneriomyces semiglobifer]
MFPALIPFGWAASTYLYWVRGRRFDTLTDILQLPDPHTSPGAAFQTYEKTWAYEFPFLSRVAFHFALLRALSIPSIANAISPSTSDITGTNAARSLEDTDLLLKELTERPLSHPRAQKALHRASQICSQFQLATSEYIYILAVLVIEPCRLVEKWGYRSLTAKEKQAHYQVWRTIGESIGIRDIPSTYHALSEYLDDFERQHAGPSPSAPQMASVAISLFIETLPFKSLHHILTPLISRLIHSLLDPTVRQTLRLSSPPYVITWLADFILRSHAVFVRYCLPPRDEPCKRTPSIAAGPSGRYIPVQHVYGHFYVHGYRVDDLGKSMTFDLGGNETKQSRVRRTISFDWPRLQAPSIREMTPHSNAATDDKSATTGANSKSAVATTKPSPTLKHRHSIHFGSTVQSGAYTTTTQSRTHHNNINDTDDSKIAFRRFRTISKMESLDLPIHAPTPRRAARLTIPFAGAAECDTAVTGFQ